MSETREKTSVPKSSVPMHPVKSSSLTHLGHDGKDLHAVFASGQRYVYHDVPEAVFQELLKADSHGTHFARHIRGAYLFDKVS